MSQWTHYIRHRMLFAMLIIALIAFLFLLWVPAAYLPRIGTDTQDHGLFFWCLTILLYGSVRIKLITAACLLLVLAVASELSQYWVPYRVSSWSDLQADMIGIGLGLVTISLFRYWRSKR